MGFIIIFLHLSFSRNTVISREMRDKNYKISREILEKEFSRRNTTRYVILEFLGKLENTMVDIGPTFLRA